MFVVEGPIMLRLCPYGRMVYLPTPYALCTLDTTCLQMVALIDELTHVSCAGDGEDNG
jgi:hypothetical protein